MDRRNGKTDQKAERKSRKERLPSLPALTGETQPSQFQNTTTRESTGVPAKRQPENYYRTLEPDSLNLPTIPNEVKNTSTMENSVYTEIPVVLNSHRVNTNELRDQRSIVGRNRANSNNSTYESIDNCLNPETVYLEVLP